MAINADLWIALVLSTYLATSHAATHSTSHGITTATHSDLSRCRAVTMHESSTIDKTVICSPFLRDRLGTLDFGGDVLAPLVLREWYRHQGSPWQLRSDEASTGETPARRTDTFGTRRAKLRVHSSPSCG
ncbi:hypothetical protein G6O67_003226 [Ophiocordyceps sinensis]|uniref:Secreted protein n=1 Tax=Ophiocordyceps sinensis TaxID=72228 RepID=A0A8H4PWB2_9HYPO|nr:hypothetical protein G6O67_003226 [Ophiocordyceps sinensis]